MSNLLDKASVILTPTAYDNGKALCVKPSDGSGDFDFSRNSAATRVNAQGLVENVQILSSNLVQNGDFSEEGVEEVSNGSFSQEGVELVTNGDFATDTNWLGVNSDGVTISNGSLNYLNTPYAKQIIQTNVTTIGKTYKVTYTISNFVEGNIRLALGGNTAALRNANGTYTDYVTASVNNHLTFVVLGSPTTLSIDNVSVREVGQDWTLGTGWSIGEDKVVGDGTMGANVFGQNVGFTQGNTYKFSFTIEDYISGSIYIREPFNGYLEPVNSNGDFSFYYVAGASNQLDFRGNSFIGSITNISVKEVGQNWDILNDVTSFSFENGIANIQGTANSPNNGIKQASISAVIGKTYKISATLRSNDGGLYRFRLLDGSYFDLGSGNSTEFETITSYHTATSTAFTIFASSWYTSGTSNFDISNISVIEISSDTNLPRINYEGFSYQDALGSELVLNGGFDTDSDWDLGTGWSISGGEAVALNSASGQRLTQDNILQVGKIYKLTYEVKSISSGGFKAFVGGVALQSISNIGVYAETMTTPTINDDFFIRTLGTTTGSIDNVSVKEYLGQEVVPDSGCGSWLFEPQSTNTINNSNSDFLAFNMDLVYNDVKSPDGTQNAFKATTTTTGGSQFRPNQVIITPSTFSIFLKYGNNQWYQVINSSAVGFYANLDVENGVFGTSGADTDNLSVKDYGNGWYRFSGTFTSASTNGSIRVYASSFSSAGWAGVSAPIGSYVYGYGMQVEALNYATSYIPTNGSTVTRNQDVCTNGGSLASINSTEGVLYAEIAALSNENQTNRYITISSGSTSNRMILRYTNTGVSIYIIANGTGALSGGFNFADRTQTIKAALRWANNDVALFVDGIKRFQGNSFTTYSPNTLNRLNMASVNGGSFPFFGKTKALAVWKEALSDSELQSLTTI